MAVKFRELKTNSLSCKKEVLFTFVLNCTSNWMEIHFFPDDRLFYPEITCINVSLGINISCCAYIELLITRYCSENVKNSDIYVVKWLVWVINFDKLG